MGVRFERIAALKALLECNGVHLTEDDRSVSVLSDWMLSEVTPSEYLEGEPEGRWFGVAFDAGLYLGELLIARAPGLRWEFNTFEKAGRGYQRHVIHGFNAPYNKFYLAPEVEVVDIMRDAVNGRPVQTPTRTCATSSPAPQAAQNPVSTT